MLSYVMIDPGAPFPHIQDAPQTVSYVRSRGLGNDDDNGNGAAPARMSSRELFDQLYDQNKLAFWVGGGTVGFLALVGLYNLFGGR
jgi:hypothetical protein